MIGFNYFVLFCSLAYAAAVEQKPEEGLVPPPPPEDKPPLPLPHQSEVADVASRELTDAGYVIRYGDGAYRYPLRIVPLVRQVQYQQRNPTDTNEIENEEDDKRRPLFYFTTYETVDDPEKRNLPTSRPYIEIRRKREAISEATPESQQESKKVNLRKKRTYCGKCGGGYGGYYVPVTYAVYPVYYGGGGGRGCNTCGGGGHGGGGGGSFSYSSSSAQSSSGSFGWGKK